MKNQMPKIIDCKIGPLPRKLPEGLLDKMPKVQITLSNNESKELFEFYPDEISFDESEFIGLTVEEAIHLKYIKDLNFLKS